MPESFTKDPAITLFGKKIPVLAENDSAAAATCQDLRSRRREEEEEEEEGEKAVKDCSEGQINENIRQDDDASPPETDDSANQEALPDSNGSTDVASISEESAKSEASKSEKEQSDGANSQGKTLKKPDKILPCPRCNSMDTKFCYYNNYNVNQPRHFCKACQRYWTAGGTMRNVPVGAGRRKNKNSASHYRHITISEALQAAHIDAPNGKHLPALKPDGIVLSFGLDAPICDSMGSVLKLVDNKVLNGTQNGFHRSFEEQRVAIPCKNGDNRDDCLSGSSVKGAYSKEEGRRNGQKEPFSRTTNGFASPVPCFPAVPWPYPWNSTVPPPSFCPPGLPMPLYPAPYWNCGIAGAWNIPLQPPRSSSMNQATPGSGPNSPTLGKHSRDAGLLKPDDLEKEEPSKHKNGCLVVPKILRIDDPSEAAKSSIWTTLGIKNESLSNGGLFKAFKPKSADKSSISEPSPALRANPAALSRSISFHERS